MPLNQAKLKNAMESARGIARGGFVLCQLKDSDDMVFLVAHDYFGGAGEAIRLIRTKSGLKGAELDQGKCCVGRAEDDGKGFTLMIDKKLSKGAWNQKAVQDGVKQACETADVGSIAVSIKQGDAAAEPEVEVTEAVGALEDDDQDEDDSISNELFEDKDYSKAANLAAPAKGIDSLTPAERMDHDARCQAGRIIGATAEEGWNIFVIGQDGRFYVGQERRPGPKGPGFNHSSFFGGGPMRSAGKIFLRGGRAIIVSGNCQGFTCSHDMMARALAKITGGKKKALADMQVQLGARQMPAADWLADYSGKDAEEAPEAAAGSEIPVKASFGAILPALAEVILRAAPSGSWLLRFDSDSGHFATSLNQGGRIIHAATQSGRGVDAVLVDLPRKLIVLPSRATLPSHGKLASGDAEDLLDRDGQWLIRSGPGGKRVISLNAGGDIKHAAIGKIGPVKLLQSLKLRPEMAVLP